MRFVCNLSWHPQVMERHSEEVLLAMQWRILICMTNVLGAGINSLEKMTVF